MRHTFWSQIGAPEGQCAFEFVQATQKPLGAQAGVVPFFFLHCASDEQPVQTFLASSQKDLAGAGQWSSLVHSTQRPSAAQAGVAVFLALH